MLHRTWRILVLGGGPLACLAAAGCVGLLLPPRPSSLPIPDLHGRVLTVAVVPDYLPFSRVDPDTGEVTGWAYDLICTLAARLNFEPRFVGVPQPELLDDVAAGRYDLAGGGVSFTLERATTLNFTVPYLLTKQRVVVRAADTRAATLSAFRDQIGLMVGTLPGTMEYDAAVAYFGAGRVRSYATFAAALAAVLDGTLDGAVVPDPALQAAEEAVPGSLQALSGPLAGEVLAYVLAPGSDLQVPLQVAYQALQTEGALDALRDKWGMRLEQ